MKTNSKNREPFKIGLSVPIYSLCSPKVPYFLGVYLNG